MMKKMLFILLIIPVSFYGQVPRSLKPFLGMMPENSRPVHLPQRLYTPDYDLVSRFDYRQKFRISVINSDSVYRLVFQRYNLTKDSLKKWISGPDSLWYLEDDSAMYKFYCGYLADSLPSFDFSKVELVLYSACLQCFTHCNHHGERDEPCHRNVCHFTDKWFVKQKEPLITKRDEHPY